MRKILLAAFVVSAITPAFAAETWYIVQDSGTKKCMIVEKKPEVKTTIVLGDGKVFTTRTEAETALKTYKVCSAM